MSSNFLNFSASQFKNIDSYWIDGLLEQNLLTEKSFETKTENTKITLKTNSKTDGLSWFDNQNKQHRLNYGQAA